MTIKQLISANLSASQYQIMLYCIMKRDTDGKFTFGKEALDDLAVITSKKRRTLMLSFYSLRDTFFTRLYFKRYQFCSPNEESNDTLS